MICFAGLLIFCELDQLHTPRESLHLQYYIVLLYEVVRGKIRGGSKNFSKGWLYNIVVTFNANGVEGE